MEHPTCKTCPFWTQLSYDRKKNKNTPSRKKLGYCWRYPPVFVGGSIPFLSEDVAYEEPSFWQSPVTWDFEVCGEHPEVLDKFGKEISKRAEWLINKKSSQNRMKLKPNISSRGKPKNAKIK